MIAIFAQIMALSLGIALSPTPVMGTIFMMVAPGSGRNSVAFVCGWVSGVALSVTGCTLLASVLPRREDTLRDSLSVETPLIGWLLIVFGVLIAIVAAVQFRRSRQPGYQTSQPAWVKLADKLTFVHVMLIGTVYAAFRPKNLLIALATGVIIGSSQFGLLASVLAIVLFTALASFTIAAPIIAYYSTSPRVDGVLKRVSDWLLVNATTVTSIAMCMLALMLTVNGILRLA